MRTIASVDEGGQMRVTKTAVSAQDIGRPRYLANWHLPISEVGYMRYLPNTEGVLPILCNYNLPISEVGYIWRLPK